MKQKLRLLATLWPKSYTVQTQCIASVRCIASLPPPRCLASCCILFMCMCAVQQVSAQEAEPVATASAGITPLQIGDTIPDEVWNMPLQVVNHPVGKETITLNDYRGKLILLDFWATFCGSCISAMPKIHEVQRQFADEMVVIPVSWSKPEATEQTLRNHQTLWPLGLSSVVEAKALIGLFPHQVVPHYVWIDPQGRVVATTATNDVSVDNIAKVLDGEEPDYALKTHIDTDKPLLFASEVLPKGAEVRQYAVFIRGTMPSMASKITLRKTGDTVHGMAISNRPLLSMYTTIALQMWGEHPGKRLVVVDSIADGSPHTLDFILPADQADSLYPRVLAFLNQQSGYTGQWVERRRTCLVLTKTNGTNRFIGNEGERSRKADSLTFQINNYPIGQFVQQLNWEDMSGDLPVLNETEYEGPVSVTLHAPFDDIDNVRRQLHVHGLDLLETERTVEIFEIRKSPDQAVYSAGH